MGGLEMIVDRLAVTFLKYRGNEIEDQSKNQYIKCCFFLLRQPVLLWYLTK